MFLRFSGCDSLRLASGLTRRSVKIRLEPHHCEVGLPWRFMRRARATRRNSSGALCPKIPKGPIAADQKDIIRRLGASLRSLPPMPTSAISIDVISSRVFRVEQIVEAASLSIESLDRQMRGISMGEWLLSRRDRLIVARYEVPGQRHPKSDWMIGVTKLRKTKLKQLVLYYLLRSQGVRSAFIPSGGIVSLRRRGAKRSVRTGPRMEVVSISTRTTLSNRPSIRR